MSIKSFRFRLVLNHPASQQDKIGEQLFCGGHDDFVITTDHDLTALDAEVNAASLEDAMSTAVRCVRGEGFGVVEIQINSEHFSQIAGMDD